MRHLSFLFLFCSAFGITNAEPVCHKCEAIREYNRTHKETDFIYYEDYVKDKEEKAKQNPPPAKSDEKPASEQSK